MKKILKIQKHSDLKSNVIIIFFIGVNISGNLYFNVPFTTLPFTKKYQSVYLPVDRMIFNPNKTQYLSTVTYQNAIHNGWVSHTMQCQACARANANTVLPVMPTQ